MEDELGEGDWAVFPLVRFGPTQTSARGRIEALRPPHLFRSHPLGTDDRGRDVFARLVYGARTSLTVGLIAVIAFVGIGALLGALAGFYGGFIDSVVSRLVETLTAFPTLVLVLVVQALLPKPSMATMLLAIGLQRDDVFIANTVVSIASVVLIEASLAFLRVGLPPPTPSWGEMLSEARDHATAWWLLLLPGLAVFGTVVSLNLVGEALRDSLDPRLKLVGEGATKVTIPRSR